MTIIKTSLHNSGVLFGPNGSMYIPVKGKFESKSKIVKDCFRISMDALFRI